MLRKAYATAIGIGLYLSLLSFSASAADKPVQPPSRITVKSEDFEGKRFDWKTQTSDIERVLTLGAAQLLPYFPERQLNGIIVRHYEEYPATLSNKAPTGEYQVLLATSEYYWGQYTYQFAHELGHVLIGAQDPHPDNKDQWFKEALCVTASMFVLSKMPEAWDKAPPISSLDKWGVHFKTYLDHILANLSYRLPSDMTMTQWILEKLPVLVNEQETTQRSMLVASYLFPIFRDSPEGWESLSYLPSRQADRQLPFKEYLKRWRDDVPEKHKKFIGKMQKLFGFV